MLNKKFFSENGRFLQSWSKMFFFVIGLMSILWRWHINFQSSGIPGIDGGYYAVQVRNLVEKGYLALNDWPLIFYLDFYIIKIFKTFGMVIDDQFIINCIKSIDIILIPLILIPIWKIYKLLGVDFSARFPKYAGLYSVFSLAPLMMVGDMQKNAVGLVFFTWFLYFSLIFFKYERIKAYYLSLLFIALISFSHFGTFMVVLLTFIVSHFIFRTPFRKIILGLVLIFVLIYVNTLFRPDRYDIVSKFTDFHNFSIMMLLIALFRSIILLYLVFFGLYALKNDKFKDIAFNKKLLYALLFITIVSFFSLIEVDIFFRVMIIFHILVVVFIILLKPIMNNLQSGVLAILIFLSIFSGLMISSSFKRDFISDSYRSDFQNIKSVIEPDKSMIYASREIAWWSAWYLRSKIHITQGELPESDNKNTMLKKYVLVQNYVVPFGVKLSFPEPKAKDLTLIHKNKSFSLYSYPTN